MLMSCWYNYKISPPDYVVLRELPWELSELDNGGLTAAAGKHPQFPVAFMVVMDTQNVLGLSP